MSDFVLIIMVCMAVVTLIQGPAWARLFLGVSAVIVGLVLLFAWGLST